MMFGMLTRDDLAQILRSVNVNDVARLSGLSTKTIYRLRHKVHSPTLDTVDAILGAVRKLKHRKQSA